MSESWQHAFLVSKLINWIKKQTDSKGLVLADTALYPTMQKTFKIGESIPDVYATYYVGTEKKVIVGEAKTSGDLENSHTYEQIASFIKYCNQNNGLFVMAVYWDQVVLCRNIIRDITNELDIEFSEYSVIKQIVNTSKNAEDYFKK